MDAPMHNIADSPMQNIYEKLTNISLSMEHRPVVACHICYYQLRKCYELMVRSVRADKVLTQIIESGQLETEESIAVLIREARQHNLSITPIKIFTITGTDHNPIKIEIDEEPMSPQYIEKSETDGPAHAEHLKLEESENDEDMEEEFLADVDIESNTLKHDRDIEQDSDPLNVCVPAEDIKTEEVTDRRYIKSEETENIINGKEYEDAATSEKCEQTPAENTERAFNLPPGGKNIPEKLTRLESTTVKEMKTRYNSYETIIVTHTSRNRHVSTNTSMCSDAATNKANITVDSDNDYTSTDRDVDVSNSKHLMNMFICNDCGDMFTEKYLLIEHIKHHDVVQRSTGLASDERSSHQRATLHERRFSRTGVGIKHTETHGGKNRFDCEICQRKFSLRYNLKRHYRTHTGEKPFECEICKVRFSRKPNLKTHLRTHTREKSFECEICKVRYIQRGHLKTHLRTHTGEKPFECEICKVRFNEKGHLKTHLRTHTGEKPFECEICKVRFNQKSNLKRHLRKHTGEKPFECEICKVRFIQKSNLKIHLSKHTGDKLFECEVCKVRFNQKAHLKIHLSKHTGEKPFKCEVCKVRFNQKGHLKIHLNKHTGEKLFECEVCKVRFSQKGSLKRHLLTHTGEKPFECEICKVRFSHKLSLNLHLRKHTGQEPFECEICKVRFNQKGNLKIHLSKHTGENPFECEVCKVRFSQKGSLKRHLLTHTGEKPL